MFPSDAAMESHFTEITLRYQAAATSLSCLINLRLFGPCRDIKLIEDINVCDVPLQLAPRLKSSLLGSLGFFF
jgi:hypothetical protein